MLSRRALLQSAGWPVVLAALPGSAAATAGIAWSAPIELARGAGVRGPWQQNDSRYDFVDDPAVALGADGALLVAWVDQASKAVLVQRRAAGGAPQGPPVRVDGRPQTFSWMPRIAIAPDRQQEVCVLWQEIIFTGGSHGGEMLLARSRDGGRSFAEPVNLSSSTGGDGKGRVTPEYWHNGSYDLLAGPGGTVDVAWTEYDGPLWVASSHDGGARFSRPALVAGGQGERPARAPTVARAPDGALLLAWTVGDEPQANIRVARANASGRFGQPALVGGPGYSDAPRLAVDGRGSVHLVWGESEGGPFRRQRIWHARSGDGGRTFEAARVAAEPPAGALGAGFPSLALAAGGTLVLVAELQRDLRQRPAGLGWSVSRDGGTTFTPLLEVPHSRDPGGGANGSSQGLLLPKLAANARGDIVVANSALREGSHSRVWLVPGRLEA